MCHQAPIVQGTNQKRYENINKDSLMMDMFEKLHVKNILCAYKVGSTK